MTCLDQIVGYNSLRGNTIQVSQFLGAWEWIIASPLVYDNPANECRCTGDCGYVDCSGGQCLGCRAAALLLPAPCMNSFEIADWCYHAPRPQWMIDFYGPGQGTMITAVQALNTPGAWAIHGNNFGMSPDSSGDGHIKVKYYVVNGDNNVSAEAMGHFAGIGYSQFIDGRSYTFYLPPGMTGFAGQAPATPPEEADMQIWVQCNNKPAQNGGLDQPGALFVPADPKLFPKGIVVLKNGATIGHLDEATATIIPSSMLGKPGGDLLWIPTLRAGATKWVTMSAKPSGHGVTLVDDRGQTCGNNVGFWA